MQKPMLKQTREWMDSSEEISEQLLGEILGMEKEMMMFGRQLSRLGSSCKVFIVFTMPNPVLSSRERCRGVECQGDIE